MKQHLIIYAKRPLGHHAKTRLGSVMGHEEAAGVYARLLYTLLIDIACADLPDTVRELSVATEEDVPYFRSAFPEFAVRAQVPGDLGTRIASTFADAFKAGAESVVLTGSDIPGLTANRVRQAFTALRSHDAPGVIPGVIGPAADGGYYLIGMRAPSAPLFDGIAWSTAGVLAQTEALARLNNVALVHLPILADVDVAEDYQTWRTSLRTTCGDQGPTPRPMEK
jgi:uncharacterized protein